MKLNIISKSKLTKSWLYNKIGYVSDTFFELSKSALSVTKKSKSVMIVARHHYCETWQLYPALSLKELKSLLDLQKQVSSGFSPIQQYFVNKEHDGFDVKTITFSSELNTLLPAETILIPETELFDLVNINRFICELETPAGVLFLAKTDTKTHSAYRKGMVNNVTTFKMSVGLSDTVEQKLFTEVDFLKLLKNGLLNLPIKKLLSLSSFKINLFIQPKSMHALYWAPLITALLFLISTNSYLIYKNNILENNLTAKGSIVDELLNFKQQQDQHSELIKLLNSEIKTHKAVLPSWDIVHQATIQGMEVHQFRKRDGKIILRGIADNASKVLAGVNKLPQVSSAVFDGAVRKSRGQDYFIIQLQLGRDL